MLIATYNGHPMIFSPICFITYFHFLNDGLTSVWSNNRNGKIHWTITFQDLCSISPCLLLVKFMQINYNRFVFSNGLKIGNRRKETCGIQHYLIFVNNLFQRIPPSVAFLENHTIDALPIMWSSGTKPQTLESAELNLLSPIIQ